MADANITKVYLLDVPLENDYKNTLYFTSKSTQESYFKSKVVKTYSYDDFYYQRKDNIMRISEHIDKLYNCNYVMYQNTNYTNKWFYAFIKEMKYVNEGTTELIIETDVIQTWMFDYTIKPSFVEREHVDNDTIGLHTVPENVETGEYICNSLSRDNELEDHVYVLMVTEWTTGTNKPLATNYGGIFSAGGAYICSTMNEVVNILSVLDNAGKSEAVVAVYMCPKKIVNHTGETLQYEGLSKPTTYTHSIDKSLALNEYEPRNKKLLTYPYQYILLSNNSGNSNILQYEHFSSEKCEFEIEGVPTIGGSIKCVPLNYKGIERIQEEGIMLGKFPTLSWSADLYTNWLTQNAVNIGIGIASSGLNVIGGVGMMASGGGAVAGAGMVASGTLGIAQTIGQVYEKSFTPNSARGNINGGDINTAYKMNKFYFYQMSIKREYAKIIDKYFDMFGYKVNMVKVPNKAHRSRWWFTKTIDINIDGAIPMDDMNKIKSAYNNGITFWRNANEIQNYDLTNVIAITE